MSSNYSYNLNSASPTNSSQAYLLGSGPIAQALLAIVLGLVLYVVMMAMEIVYSTWLKASRTRVDILPYRVNADDKMRTYTQNPKAPNATLLPLSDNERTGAEFTYTFFLYANPSSMEASEGLRHILHKGYSRFFPLMGPGVFMKTNENTLRVYMNSTKKWDNYVEIPNIPLKKWVHCAIVGRKNSVEIYINGNIAKKLNMDGVMYQNYQDLILFSQRPGRLGTSALAGSGSTPQIEVKGPFTGSVASLAYFSYALSYSEIQGLLNEGPSEEAEESASSGTASPYLTDNWWISN